MRVIVFGATGKTGRHVCRQALEQGHEVTAFTRSANWIDHTDSSLRVAQGDVMDAESVAASVAGHDAAIIVLGSNGLRDKSTLAVGTKNVLDGMAQHHVGRLVVLSAAGVGESWGKSRGPPALFSGRCCAISTLTTRRRRRHQGKLPGLDDCSRRHPER